LLLYSEGGYPYYCCSNIEYTTCLGRKQTLEKTPVPESAQYPAKDTAINSFRTKTGIPILTLLLYPEGGYPHYCYSNIEYTPCLDRKQTLVKTPAPEFTQYPAKNTANNSFRTKTGIPILTLLLHPEGGYRHYWYSNIEYTPFLDRKQTLIKTSTPEFAQYPAKNTAINSFRKKTGIPILTVAALSGRWLPSLLLF